MTEEIRTTSATGGQKGVKAQRHSLLPRHGLDVIAEVFGFGAQKYDDHNWRRGYEWSKSYDALQRHLTAWWDGEDIDPESGLSHLGHAGFHILVLATWERLDGQGSQFDDRHTFNRPECPGADGEECDGSITFGPLSEENGWRDVGYTTEEGIAEEAGFKDYYQAPAWTQPPYPLTFKPPTPFLDAEIDWKDPEPPSLIETQEALTNLLKAATTPPRYIQIPALDPEVLATAVSKLRASEIWTIPEEPQYGEFDVVDLTPHQEVLREYVRKVNEAAERVAGRVVRKAARFSVDIVGVTTDLDDIEEDWGPTTRARLQEFFTNRG